jgi:DNA polymerase-1
MLAVGYVTIALSIYSFFRRKDPPSARAGWRRVLDAPWLIPWLTAGTIGVVALGISCGKMLPTLSFLRQFPRVFTPTETHAATEVFSGFWARYGIVWVLGLVGVFTADAAAGIFLGGAALFFALQMGDYGPTSPFHILKSLPIFGQLRFPDRFVVMILLFGSVAASRGITRVEDAFPAFVKRAWELLFAWKHRAGSKHAGKPIPAYPKLASWVFVALAAALAFQKVVRPELEALLPGVRIRPGTMYVYEAPRRYETIVDEAALDRWIEALSRAELFAFDTETTSLDYMQAEIVGLSFCIEPGVAAYVPVGHDYAGAPDQLARELVLAKLKPVLEDPARGKLGHHLKYDMHVLRNHGIRLAGVRYDTMLESYVWNSVATRHDMDSAAGRYLGLQTIHYEDVAGKGAKQISFNQVPIDRAAEYAAEDADVTLRLHRTLWPAIASVPTLERVYTTIEQPLVPVLFAMEHAGVLLDPAKLKEQSRELAARLVGIEAEAHREAGQPFNLDSPKQLQFVLFEKLGIAPLRKTPTGQPSTAEDVLEELAAEHALPRLILEYRGLAKLRSTYTEKLPEQVNPRTGRVHTSYHQAVAQTGRLSSTDPNLQNIPIRTPEGRRIRQAFVAPAGHVLMAADYSQIELRIMAHLSDDEGLLAAFAAGEDVHRATAAEVFGVAPGAVSSDQRRSAKAINFGLIYGMSAFGLARQLGIDRGAAQQYVNRYFERYPGVKRYMDDTRERARRDGYVETVMGRRLYLPDIRSRNKQLQQYAERSAINAPMQGTAADIIKRAMIDVHAWCVTEHPPARLIMQVHDELVLEVRADAVTQVGDRLRRCMTDAANLKVSLKVDIGTGANWDEAH